MNDQKVFVNCPFDEDYRPSFEVMVFVIAASGYRVSCSLEENDFGDIRFDKLCRLIAESDRSVHDLSRTEIGPSGLPRFNMPFELGLVMGAKRFGGQRHKGKTALIMVKEPYRLPGYLSDLAGNDPEAHHGRLEEIVRVIRRYLHQRPDGSTLPGPERLLAEFGSFGVWLNERAKRLHLKSDDIHPFKEYRTYMALLTEFLRLA